MSDLLSRLQALTPQQRQLLARQIRQKKQDILKLTPVPRAAAGTPLAVDQRRMWAQHVEAPNVPVNIVSQIMTLEGSLDVNRLTAALEILVRRHEALRTVIERVDGEPRQKVLEELQVPLEHAEIEAGAAEGRDAALDQMAREQSWRPFDLATGPLVRLTLVRLDPEHHALLVAAHNVVFDAWSYSIVIEELIALYNAPEKGESVLPELSVQYPDFADWQHRWLASSPFQEQLEYWRGNLQPPLPAPLPTDRPRRAEPSHDGKRLSFELSPEIKQQLIELGRREGATLFMTLVALVQRFLHQQTGGSDVIVGTLSANRSQPEIEHVIGYFLNVVPLRTDFSDDPDWPLLLRRVRKAALGAQAHAGVPFESLVENLRPGTEDGRNPFFDVLFVFENIPPPEETLEGLAITTRDVDKKVARYDLTLSIYDEDERLHGWFEYRTELFEEATIQSMMEAFTDFAEATASGPPRDSG